MRVLIACEFSQIVCKEFRNKGHEAYSCDILPTEGNPAWHIKDDVLKHLNDGWDLMIAHPPCTYLSNAGARFLWPKSEFNYDRYEKGLRASYFFMAFFYTGIPKVCIENPIPSKIYKLPDYNQIIQPYEFGHPYQKRTCLWLKNLPLLWATNIVTERQSTKIAGNWFNKGGKDRQRNRARTFQGVAQAMAEQWG